MLQYNKKTQQIIQNDLNVNKKIIRALYSNNRLDYYSCRAQLFDLVY